MALKKETITKIASLIKIKEDDLIKAIADEKEVDLTIEELQTFSAKELEDRDKNQRDDGIKTGKEIGAKEVKKAAGLDENSSKDPAKIAQAIADKAVADAKVKPDEKVTQLTEQVTLLQKQLGEKDTELQKEKGVSAAVAMDRKILASFPKERASTLTDDEYLTLIKGNLTFKEQDGNLIVEKNGQILRDAKTQNPLSATDAVAGIFKERKGWLNEGDGAAGGRGGGDQKPKSGVFTKKSEVIADYEAQGKSIQGEASGEIVAKLAELQKADPAFDMNN